MAQPGPFANDLDALVSLISSSVEVIKAAYAQAGSPVPSLDSIHRSPFDAGRPSPELRKAIQIIHGACTQLSTTVSNPYSALLNVRLSAYIPAAYMHIPPQITSEVSSSWQIMWKCLISVVRDSLPAV